MSSPEAFSEIQSRINAGLTGYTVKYENETFPTDGEPFFYIEVWSDMFDQASIGAGERTDNLWRENGQIVAHVMVQQGSGTATAREMSKDFYDLFRGVTDGDIRYGQIAPGGAGEPRKEDGNYFGFPVTVDWERDH